MNKIKVIIKDKNTLELVEDAKAGDIIDLRELEQLDVSFIENIIDSGKDKVFQNRLNTLEETWKVKADAQVKELENKIEALNKENKQALALKEIEVSNELKAKIKELENEIKALNAENKSNLKLADKEKENEIAKAVKEENSKYAKLEAEFNSLKSSIDDKLKQKELEVESKYAIKISELNSELIKEKDNSKITLESVIAKKDLEKEQALSKLNEFFGNEMSQLNDQLLTLQRQKASMNVKQTGEDLEAWCDNEVTSYMQNGLFNCTWEKDNTVVRYQDEAKGSKADFIFKIYVDEKCNEEDLLSSVCLEMKDENPDSKTKQTNEHYYKKLHENRQKKNCKYALLVSNLEMDKPNILPIFKVREYEDMYVVRPGYLMVFLNIITSLTMKFRDLILAKENELLELKDKHDLIDEFNKLKQSYLDSQLSSLEKQITSIQKSTESIRKSSQDIDSYCEKIISSYINKIASKLDNFELKVNRSVYKKMD